MDPVDQLLGLWNSLKKKYPDAAKELLPEFKEAMKELQGPREEAREQVHIITVIGRAADGRKYAAEFEAVFPPGTKIESVSERARPDDLGFDL